MELHVLLILNRMPLIGSSNPKFKNVFIPLFTAKCKMKK